MLDTSTGRAPRILIIGGGVAGMAAAVALESAGFRVTLLESLRRLGGRASSFHDPATGVETDNSQHVLLGCCTNLIDFYRRIGSLHKIHFHRAINFLDSTGRLHRLWGIDALPAPLHLAPAMLGFGALSASEKLAASRAMLAMMREPHTNNSLDDISFGQWLAEHRQPDSLVEKFYDPLLIGSLNEHPRAVSAKYAIQVFQGAILTNSHGYVLGLPTCPLSRLYDGFSCGDLRLGARVAELISEATERPGGRATNGRFIRAVRLASGETIPADYVIIATNRHSLRRLVPSGIAVSDPRFSCLDRLTSVPILAAHLWFDRPLLRLSHAALFSGPLQWIFRKDHSGRALCGVISAAREWLDVPHDRCIAQFEKQLLATLALNANASPRLLRGRIIIEKRATFAPLPGADRHRPGQAPPDEKSVQNLFLAGDYTRTDWPATMEGAVRSGYLAAEALLNRLQPAGSPSPSPHHRFLRPDLPPQFPAQFLAFRHSAPS